MFSHSGSQTHIQPHLVIVLYSPSSSITRAYRLHVNWYINIPSKSWTVGGVLHVHSTASQQARDQPKYKHLTIPKALNCVLITHS